MGSAAEEWRGILPRARWVNPDDYHVTLRFLGNAPAEREEEFQRLLRSACAAAVPFEMSYGTIGAFDSWDAPRVLWLGVAAGGGELTKLADAFGYDEPRPYTPHMTIARFNKPVAQTEIFAKVRERPAFGAHVRIAAASLYKVIPGSAGRYEIIATCAFGAARRAEDATA